MDTLFTSVSASCVTGLIVHDTATHWSLFGQMIILVLIQIGGLGVITVALTFFRLSGRRISLAQRNMMQQSISAPQVGGIVRRTGFIIKGSLCVELSGALLLLPVFARDFGFPKGLWYSLFHAVSAFCNAGFDLMGAQEPFSSLTGFSQNILVNVTLMTLITVGGIGFLVWNDLKEHGFHWKQYRLQSKAALFTSAWLVILPALWLFFFEMEQNPAGKRILPALFQSVTLRTAGFNTVDLNHISRSGQALMIVCMLVGGSPGSTAGGMKTTTLAVLLTTAFAVFRRKEQVTFGGRRIADDTVRQAIAILMMSAALPSNTISPPSRPASGPMSIR